MVERSFGPLLATSDLLDDEARILETAPATRHASGPVSDVPGEPLRL